MVALPRGILTLLLGIGLLSGCIVDTPAPSFSPPVSDVPPIADPFDAVRVLMDGVACEVAAVGSDTTENLKFLTNVTPESGGTVSLDIKGDLLAMGGGGGFTMANISDPLHPVILASYAETGQSADTKFSPDNQTVFVGAGWGVDIVDVTDPENPASVGQWRFDDVEPFPLGPSGSPMPVENAHMLYTAEIGGEQWLFVAANSNTGVWILKINGPPESRTLEFVTTSLPAEGGPLGPHDMWVTFDADLGMWLLYSSDGFHGWTVFDIDDPANPTPVGGIEKAESGYTHTIQAAKVGNRRIVVTTQEVGENIMEVYDATVLNAPVLLATWQIRPGSVAPQHEFNIVDGKLYLGHYGNGFFVFDLATLGPAPVAGTLDLAPIAHYSVGPPSTGATAFIDVWSVDVVKGLLYVSSMTDGVHIVGYGCLEVGNPVLTSTG